MFAPYDIKKIEREYEYKRNEANRIFLREKQSIYDKNPKLSELDLKIKKLGIEAAKLSLLNNVADKEDIKKSLEDNLIKCKNEKEKLLNELNVKLKPSYSCDKCCDTGYIWDNNGKTMCNCMKQKLISAAYINSNMYNLQNETFEKFNLDLYDGEKDQLLYKSELSPKENMQKILEIAKQFIDNFEKPEQKNLLFTGTTGTGKTFLSSSIANEILEKGYTVLYQTAPILLDNIFEYKYNTKNADGKSLYNNYFDVNLLIIDDLGTENLTPAKFAELFTILNARLITPNTKTIISTNLSLEEINRNYDSRILSRLIGSYNICRFFGNDIRLK